MRGLIIFGSFAVVGFVAACMARSTPHASIATASQTPASSEPSEQDIGDAPDESTIVDATTTSAEASAPLPMCSDVPMVMACHPQVAQSFLVRGTYIPIAAHPKEHAHSLKYLAQNYGSVPYGGTTKYNKTPVKDYLTAASFFGLPVTVNRKIVPALECVEQQIKATCPSAYTPQILAGARSKNTFRGGELSRHLFGIAVDVDGHRNPCCHCGGRDHIKICSKPHDSLFEVMDMPPCWVDAFEAYGFYWLGRDWLQDSMHFEFLGDPNAIKALAPASACVGSASSSAVTSASAN